MGFVEDCQSSPWSYYVTIKTLCQDKIFSSNTHYCFIDSYAVITVLFSISYFTGDAVEKPQQLSRLQEISTTIKCLNVTRITCIKLNSVFNLKCVFYDHHQDGNDISRTDSSAHSLQDGDLLRVFLLSCEPSAPRLHFFTECVFKKNIYFRQNFLSLSFQS